MRSSRSAPAIGGGTLGSGGKGIGTAAFRGGIAGCGGEQETDAVFGEFAADVPGVVTCRRLRNVTNSVLRLRRRCCKWTASFEEEASKRKYDFIITLINNTIC